MYLNFLKQTENYLWSKQRFVSFCEKQTIDEIASTAFRSSTIYFLLKEKNHELNLLVFSQSLT